MSKKTKIGITLVLCLTLLLGVLMVVKKEDITIELPVVLGNNYDVKKIYYGVNSDHLKETSPEYDFLSMTLDTASLESDVARIGQVAEETTHLQIILSIQDMAIENSHLELVNSQIDQLDPEKVIYISLNYDGDYKKSKAVEQYEMAEQVFDSENIHLVYNNDLYGEKENIEYLGINISKEEDIKDLKTLQAKLDEANSDKVKIIINDYIVASNEDLTIVLDLINKLYYDVALEMPNVTWINQQSHLGKSDPRVAQAYDALLQNSWLTLQEDEGTRPPYIVADAEQLMYIEDRLEIIVPVTKDIEYIEYKLNDKSLGQVFRYPYQLAHNIEDLENAYNELKIIAKVKGEEELIVDKVYFNANINNETEVVRPERTSPTYGLESNIIYDHPYIPVLMYHEFMAEVGESDDEQSITVGTQLFEDQIVAMLEGGYTPITFWDLYQYFEGKGGLPEKPVIITTDDGYLSNYEIAYPILKKYNVPATYFITSYYIGVMTTRPHFTWEQAREMEESGLIDIQSHTHTHAPMNKLTEGGVMYQAAHSFELIEKQLGERDVKVLSYPQFLHNDDTIEWVEDVDIDLQVTNLSKQKSTTQPLDIKRIHVSNETTPEGLIEEMERLTMK